nr:EXS, C-terminal [Tanacetum cinerariifolium]
MLNGVGSVFDQAWLCDRRSEKDCYRDLGIRETLLTVDLRPKEGGGGVEIGKAIRETVGSFTCIQHEQRINPSLVKGWINLRYKPIHGRNKEQGWWMRMEVLLGIHGVWDVVDPGSDDAKKNNIVKGLLFQSIPEDLVLQIGNLQIEKEMWEAIKTRNLEAERVKEARLQTLITEFENMKMLDNDTIDEYAPKLSGIVSKSATLGEVMSEHKLVKKFLTSLPRRFVHIVAALEQVLDLKKTGFKDVVGRLKAYEERVKEEDKANDPQENLLYARTEYSNGNNDSSEGRGRGSYSRGHGRGRGQGRCRDNSQNQGQRDSSKIREENKQKGKQHEKCDLSHIQCYRCDQKVRRWFVCLHKGKRIDFVPSIRCEFLTMRDSCGGLLIKVPHNENHLYKAQLKVGKECTNEVGQESDEEANPDSSFVTVHETNLESEEDKSGSDDMSIPIARLETIRLLISLAARRGWKIHHLDVKTAFLNGDRKELNSTLKEMGFLQCVHEKAVYRKVPNGEFIIVAVYGDDLFVTGTSLDCIDEFKKRMVSQFEMSYLGELTYYLCIEVSQGKDYVEIKQERYVMKILKEAGIEDCNAALCTMEPGLKLSKAEDEPERGNDMRLVGYSSHNVDIDDRRSSTGHIFYLGTSPITWCSQKQTTVALSSCEAEFMAATAAACQAIWLRDVLAEVTENEQEFASQMVPEWREAYMNYNHLKVHIKEILIFRQLQRNASMTLYQANPPLPSKGYSRKRKVSLHRAFGGLTNGNSGRKDDKEDDLILISAMLQSEEERYQMVFLRSLKDGGESELEFFKRLDDEFNKVINFYKSKVGEMVNEAEELSKQMNALIALRIKLEDPLFCNSTPIFSSSRITDEQITG